MNKTQGATVGAILAAGLLMRPTSQTTTQVPVPDHAATNDAKYVSEAVAEEEGPWIASCRYWSPARQLDSKPEHKTATVDLTVKGEDFDVANTASADLESSADFGCSSRAHEQKSHRAPTRPGNSGGAEAASDEVSSWGIPSELPGGFKPEVHALIAAVPDPVHTHLALEFDRDVDALVQAAGDNGYVPSYYWLPWKHHGGLLRTEESTGTEGINEGSSKERQPGLIIFKYIPDPNDPVGKDGYPWNSYSKVIYIFLVGQTPTLGTDGQQLKRAFLYEAELLQAARDSTPQHKARYSVSFSMRDGNRLDIIGATSSGAAASMRQAIESGRKEISRLTNKDLEVRVAGITGAKLASDLMSQPLGGDPAPNYYSFGDWLARSFVPARLLV